MAAELNTTTTTQTQNSHTPESKNNFKGGRRQYNNRGRNRGRPRGRPGGNVGGRGAGGVNHKQSSCTVCTDGEARYKCPKCRMPYCSVKCCKEHKEKLCPANNDNNVAKKDSHSEEEPSKTQASKTKKSRYLPSDLLTNDPLGNAVKRRKMLEEDSDEDDDVEEEGFRITREMMDRMDNSTWLRSELADGGLRQMIYNIDTADENAAATMGGGFYSKNRHQRKRGKKGRMNDEPEISPREAALENAKTTNPKFANFIDRLLLLSGVMIRADGQGIEGDEDLLDEEVLGNLVLAPIPRRGGALSAADIAKEVENGVTNTNDDDDDDEIDIDSDASSDDDDSDDSSSSESSSSDEER